MSVIEAEPNSPVRVSIVVPAFNAEATLEATLESLLAQTEPNWQAIVVDDGSMDGTPDLLRLWQARDHRIIGIRKDHAGVSAARNAGLSRSAGEWVLFLDADDQIPPDHLAVMLEAAADAPQATVVHAGWRRYSVDGDLLEENEAKPLTDAFAACARSCPFAIHAALTRREAAVQAGGFDETLSICEDWDLWQRLARGGAVLRPVEDHFVEVRLRAGSLSSDTRGLLEAGLREIERGFSFDPRVSDPLPAHAAGERSDGLREAQAYFAVWNLGCAIGRESELEPLFKLVPDLRLIGTVDLHAAAAVLTSGIVVGAGKPLSRWNEFWPRVAAPFDSLMQWLDERDPLARQGGWFRYRVEQHVFGSLPNAPELRVGRLRVVTMDLAQPIPDLHAGGDLDRVRCRFAIDGRSLTTVPLLIPDVLPAGVIARAALDEIGRETLSKLLGERGQPSKSVLDRVRALFSKGSKLDSAYAPLQVAASDATDPFAEIRDAAAAPWRREDHHEGGNSAEWTPPDYASRDYWESVFSTRDPWDYDNEYETLKYEQTLSLVPPGVSRALEIACAEGHFTRLLAPRVGSLLATDISGTAVERAREQYAGLTNVEFSQLDLATDEIPGKFDLIVCSEVLYYQPDAEALARFAGKVAAALNEDGHLLLAHGNLLVDEPERTGFPWPHAFGSIGIREHIGRSELLSLEREIETPLYRIQSFRRTASPLEATVETARAAVHLPLRVAAQVRWRGLREIPAADRWNNFPVLMYHRIAASGPDALSRYRLEPARFAEQLTLLRRAGWEGVTVKRLAEALYDKKPLPPRSVLLTFDDAYVDFLEEALPILHRFEYPAAVFVPVGKVSQASDWDARYGEPAPILGWNELELLRHSDVALGSHGQTHRALPALGAAEQIQELAASRAELGYRVKDDIQSIAYPFGEVTGALFNAARRCGYRLGFGCDYGWVDEGADPLALPRIEITGDLSGERFASLLGIKA